VGSVKAAGGAAIRRNDRRVIERRAAGPAITSGLASSNGRPGPSKRRGAC